MSTAQPGPDVPPVLSPNEPLGQKWNQPLSSIATLPRVVLEPGMEERHRIYSLALMSLLLQNFDGNKNGTTGNYPWRQKQQWMPLENGASLYRCRPLGTGTFEPRQRDYMGHNIAALAVDGDGDIIDFDFNHNDIFGSSVEHAEARLIRRIFSLTQINDRWNLAGTSSPSRIATNLSNVTVYTSLESCAQCSGIMTLAGVKEVVFLQKDFGTYCVGNILYNLTLHNPDVPSISAPRPIPGSDFGFQYYDQLNDKYKYFYQHVIDPATPFWTDGKPGTKYIDKVQAVTSFLCTDDAYDIYAAADCEFRNFTLQSETYSPPAAPNHPDSGVVSAPKTNADVLNDALDFVNRMQFVGRRGTPHKV